ncbi:MAG: phosphoglucosamine mutase [Cyanobacteria bacterium]|nr:phosphoglucosamine mutase [Cyanobacteriota bacterium]
MAEASGVDSSQESRVEGTARDRPKAATTGESGEPGLPPSPLGASLGAAAAGFGTDGIRGRVGTQVTPALALQVGYWCGLVLPAEGPVVIGTDSRSSGPMLVAALTAGLTAAGREVWQLGLCPTPAVPGTIRRLGAAGGLMVSASHNPPHDNGIKVFGACGAKLQRQQQQAIEAGLRGHTQAPAFHGQGTAHQRQDLLDSYRDSLLQSSKGRRLDGVKVVLDLCWGSATACGEQVFRELGADLTVLHGQPDGARINQGCGSTHLEPLRQAVLEQQAAMGFAFDGDADRVLAVDGSGRIVDGDQILYLWGTALRQAGQLPDNRIVATVMSNLGFERAWTESGGLLERTAVGDQYVHAAMQELGAGLGGEQSGHILSAEHGMSGDGLLTALQVATLVHGRGQNLAEWMDGSWQSYPQKLVNVTVQDRQKRTQWQQCESLRLAVEQAETAMAGHGRVLVRASGTEPLLRVMVEAAEQEQVDHWCEVLAAAAERGLG